MNILSKHTNFIVSAAKQIVATRRFVRTRNACKANRRFVCEHNEAFRKKWGAASALCLLAMTTFISAPLAHAQDYTSGLVAHWTLDETSGATVNDSIANDHGAIDNFATAGDFSVHGRPGVIGNAYWGFKNPVPSNNVSSGRLEGFDGNLISGGSYSLSMWLFNNRTQTNSYILRITRQAGANGGQYQMNGTTAYLGAATSPTIEKFKWQLVTLTYNSATSTCTIYVNGQPGTPDTTCTAPSDYTNIVTTFSWSHNGFEGAMDDIRLYNRALTQADIEALYLSAPCHGGPHGMGVTGEIIYNETYRVMQYCDGVTGWQSMGKEASILHGQKTSGEDYNINAVDFDGTNNFLDQTTALTGVGNTKTITYSYWIKTDATYSGVGIVFLKNDTANEFRFGHNTNGRIFIEGLNASDTVILGVNNNATNVYDGQWNHVICSFDLSSTSNRHCFVNDTDVSGTGWLTYTDDLIDFTNTGLVQIGANGSGRTDAEIADLWIDFGTYIDLSIEANRRKFINANGEAINLGTDGSLPTGTAPDIFLSGDTASWHTNKGTGGGFTENGALTNATSLPPHETQKKLVSWWRLDETAGTTATDSAASYNGLYTSGLSAASASTSGPIASGITFYGDDAHKIEVTSSVSDFWDSKDFTISAWINLQELTGYGRIIEIPDYLNLSTSFNGQELLLVAPAWDATGVWFSNTSDSIVVPVNQWAHVAVSYSYSDTGQTPTFYINGQNASLSTSVSPAGSFTSPSATKLTIGNVTDSLTQALNGHLDDVRFYNFSLDATQIAELYAASSVVYQPTAVTFETPTDELNAGANLTGVTDCKQMTISTWFKRNTGIGGNLNVIYDTSESGTFFGITDNSDSRIYFIDDNVVRIGAQTPITDTNWHHIMLSFDLTDPAKAHVYLDGNSEPYITEYVDTPMNLVAADHLIANTNSGGLRWEGDIADLWINHCNYIDLSIPANRAKFLSTNGGPKDLGANGELPTGTPPIVFLSGDAANWHTNKGTGGGFTVTGDLTNLTPTAPTGINPRYCANPSLAEGTLIYNNDENVVQYCDGYQHIALGPQGDGGGGCSDPTGSAGEMYFNETFKTFQYCEGDEWIGVGGDKTDYALSQGLVGHWKLDETSGTTATDSSGNGKDGSMNGGLDAGNDSVIGPMATGLSFDGTDDQIVIPDDPIFDMSSALTLSVWAKITDASNVNSMIHKYGGGDSAYKLFYDSGNLTFALSADGTSGTASSIDYAMSPDPNIWYHFAATYDGTTMRLYLDSVEIGSQAHAGGIFNSSLPIRLGQNYYANNYEGHMDDARIYDRALSAGEVAALYDQVDPCIGVPTAGTVCRDGSVFIGLRDYGFGDEKIFTTPSDSGNGRWKSGIADGDNISIDSGTDGKINVANIVSPLTNYPAIETCENLTDHGKTDWYLPSISELSWTRTTLSLNTATRWSSTEGNAANAKAHSGATFDVDKDSGIPRTRCIRRD